MISMNSKLNLYIRILFYFLWLIGLSVRAYYTELTSDEAYYWMYSQKPAWGYFDHPPIIALIIKLGYIIKQNEVGVRFFSIIFSVLTIFIIEKIIKPKDIKSFYLLVSSVGILHFIGFYAIPDSPFLLTFVVYLLLYKEFTISPSLKNAFLLGLITALMCLSKYHGFIIIGLTVLSNLKLIFNRYFWLTAVISISLLIPHFLWQLNSNFPSFKYHFFERSVEAYNINYSFEYLISQLFVTGPITGIIFFIAAIKEQVKNQFEKTLKFLFWGGYMFFFLMTFKGRVEAHWTIFIVMPALYFAYNYLTSLKNSKQILRLTFIISLIMIVSAGLFIVIDSKLDNALMFTKLKSNFRNKNDMLAIKKVADNRPVAFINSYQKASLYSFYTQSEAFSLNNIMGRKNQFDTWNCEEQFRGKNIIIIPNYYENKFDNIPNTSKKYCYTFINNFQSFSKIRIRPTALEKEARVSDTVQVTLILSNTSNTPLNINANPDYPSYLYYCFFKEKTIIKQGKSIRISDDMLNKELSVDIAVPDAQGLYGLCFSIETGWLPPTINSKRYKIKVID